MDRKDPDLTTPDPGAILGAVRSSLLILAQHGVSADLDAARRDLAALREVAVAEGLGATAENLRSAEAAVDALIRSVPPHLPTVYETLDRIALIEAAFLDAPIHSEDFLRDVAAFLDASFVDMSLQPGPDGPDEEVFEVDEEALEVFRSEADELLDAISLHLETLAACPTDSIAVWEMRRCAHTFKGAAGIVGFRDASTIAHQIEDLLDKLVEGRSEAFPQVTAFLQTATESLRSIVHSTAAADETLQTQFAAAMDRLSDRVEAEVVDLPDQPLSSATETPKPTATPVVRVSLDRLDDLAEISRSLQANRAALLEQFSILAGSSDTEQDARSRIDSLFERARSLTQELQTGLLQIRMVKFGTLETRLNRAVRTTCVEENKKALLSLENGHVEIDTLVIDALIEPLIHLLKNAVVHGIEAPETRRLIGKPESGSISVRLEADDEALVLTVSDDGGGISPVKLKEKAVAAGKLSAGGSSGMDDRSALELIFIPGLTTTEKVNLNAGRGVGMTIVKESVEDRGGSVFVESQPQVGTRFTIFMPLAVPEILADQPAVPDAPGNTLADRGLVLVVDDSSSVRLQAVRIIEDCGFRAITANNGADALELLLSGKWEPDLILSDVEMPQINGWEFLEYVKTDNNFGHIPVVMVTSLDSYIHRQRAIDLGAADYIIKPFAEGDLERVLEALRDPAAA